jgi:hypothetical protein
MTAAGWLLLVLSCGSITGLVVYCFWLVLTTPHAAEDLHAPLDIETGDSENDR